MADYQDGAGPQKETDTLVPQKTGAHRTSAATERPGYTNESLNISEEDEDSTTWITIHRQAYTNETFNHQFHHQEPESTLSKDCIKQYCASKCSVRTLLGFCPFISLLRNYKWKQWILFDIIAGLSVGVIHIPQGMGFALLTSLPAVYGLYASFFPVVIYFFFGTSHHISVGTMAVISLMIGAIVDDQTHHLNATETDGWSNGGTLSTLELDKSTVGYDGDEQSDQEVQYKIDVAMSVTILMGLFQFLMGILNLRILATFMSMPFVSGFMTGAAFHIATSQVPFLFGIKIGRVTGVLTLPKKYVAIFTHISETIPGEIICGLICIAILVVLKEIINERFKNKLKVPIPAEIILVVLSTLVSYLGNLNATFNIRILSHIPQGIPAPSVPHFINWQSYVGQSFIIAVVSFAISISMAKIFTRKHNYTIDINQELIAYGLSYGIGGFFHSFGGAVAPPRSIVHESTGGKTQIASLVSSVLVLLVCLAIGPLFENLPNSALAAIIIVALFPMFKLFKDAAMLWRVNKYDFTIWFVTWASVVFLDITIGLVIGLGYSLLTIVIQGLCTRGSRLARAGDGDIYVPTVQCDTLNEPSKVKLYRFNGPLYFVNVERFKSDLQQIVNPMNYEADIKPTVSQNVTHEIQPENKESEACTENTVNNETCESLSNEDMEHPRGDAVTTIIMDCSAISYVDYMGASMIKMLQADYKKVGVRFVLACCGTTLIARLEAVGLLGNESSYDDIFPTVHDAVAICCHKSDRSAP